MFKFAFAVGLVAMMTASPRVALAETGQPAAPGATPHAPHHAQAHRPTRSYKSEMRHRSNLSKERARASAEHMRTLRDH